MSEWLISLGPDNGAFVAFLAAAVITVLGIVLGCSIVGCVQSACTARSQARIAEANARIAEAKERRAALGTDTPSTAEQMAATPDHPSLRKGPRGVVD